MEWLAVVILVFGGISVGIKVSMVGQFVVLGVAVLFLNSRWFQRMEIAGLIPLLGIVFFFGGVVIGDLIYWSKFYDGKLDFIGTLTFFFTP